MPAIQREVRTLSTPVTDSGIVRSGDNRTQVRAYDAQSGEQLDTTSVGLSVTGAAVDRVLLAGDLIDVVATEL